jgi:hypothetical protein
MRLSEEALTLSVPEAGKRYFGLSRNSSYIAVERGEIPVIRVGRLLRVPVRAMERLLDGAGAKPAEAKPAPSTKPRKRRNSR